eukprot:659980-Rhodomonas_salina.2
MTAKVLAESIATPTDIAALGGELKENCALSPGPSAYPATPFPATVETRPELVLRCRILLFPASTTSAPDVEITAIPDGLENLAFVPAPST